MVQSTRELEGWALRAVPEAGRLPFYPLIHLVSNPFDKGGLKPHVLGAIVTDMGCELRIGQLSTGKESQLSKNKDKCSGSSVKMVPWHVHQNKCIWGFEEGNRDQGKFAGSDYYTKAGDVFKKAAAIL